jgi:hypothetical protein
MIDKKQTIIFKSIFISSGIILIFDWMAKLSNISHLLLAAKWLTTFTYPIIAVYVYFMGFGLDAHDLSSLGRPKLEKILLPIIKYFLIFCLILLLPSCLAFWRQFPSNIYRTIKFAVLFTFPVAALILALAARYGSVPAKYEDGAEPTHNQEDAPDPKTVR